MPPAKPRYTFIDAGELREMLDEAQARWPDVQDRGQLLMRLATEGRDALRREASEHQRAVAVTAGALTGVYSPRSLAELREDWPD